MNPNASTWAPTGAPVPAPEPQTSNVSEEMDENDALWQAVLKISEGDRAKAKAMLDDPDQLVMYPEIEALMAGDTPMDNWENQKDDLAEQVAEKMTLQDETEEEKPVEAAAPDTEAMEDDEPVQSAGEIKEGDPREHLNLVFIGHVDAGKSTLSGNILYLTENVDKRTIERYEREAKERNRDSWFLAYIMDTNEEERAKGKTVEVGKAYLTTDVKRYTILDAPGHKNYVPNMIQGASQADVGILVISARKGEFETGFDRGGQTREHALLAKTLGVSYLIVAVNKMDEPTVQWKKERFDECVAKIRPYLKGCGFTIKREVKFIPISALSGANVKDEVDSSVCSWWKECHSSGENNTSSPTLLSLLDSLSIQERDQNAPLRIPVLDRYSDRGTVAMGKVESGVVRAGMKVIVMPTRNTYKVDEVYCNEDLVSIARPGENVLIKLSGAKMEDIRKGFVICTDPPCRAVSKIIAQVAITDMPETMRVMTAGFQCMFHAHTEEQECTIVKVFETTNNKGVVNKQAKFATVGMKAVVMLELGQTVSLETYDHMPFLGRFTLRTEGKTIAIGKITKVPPKKE
jgi:peptide chain release factor subunit 3